LELTNKDIGFPNIRASIATEVAETMYSNNNNKNGLIFIISLSGLAPLRFNISEEACIPAHKKAIAAKMKDRVCVTGRIIKDETIISSTKKLWMKNRYATKPNAIFKIFIIHSLCNH
jgi:hypothetical protein